MATGLECLLAFAGFSVYFVLPRWFVFPSLSEGNRVDAVWLFHLEIYGVDVDKKIYIS